MAARGDTNIARFPLFKSESALSQAIVAIVRRLSKARTIVEIMDIVTRAARDLLAADGVTFVLRDGDRCFYAEEDSISPLWKGKRFPMEACISGWCMKERQAVAIGDIYRDARIPVDAYRPTFVRSLAMAPIREEDPVGALGAYWSLVRDTTAQELDLLQTLANSAALAIAKIELEAEREKSKLVHAETAHRLKNLLTVVDALSRQALKRSSDLSAYSESFSRRLAALARAQDLLLASKAIELRRLVREQLAVGEEDGCVICTGPDLSLPADLATDLGLALHELGTNARKYGALSRDGGRVLVDWRVEAVGEGGQRLEISWRELGGPPVNRPASNGFGGVLVRHALDKYGGVTSLDFDPAGVICRMSMPLR